MYLMGNFTAMLFVIIQPILERIDIAKPSACVLNLLHEVVTSEQQEWLQVISIYEDLQGCCFSRPSPMAVHFACTWVFMCGKLTLTLAIRCKMMGVHTIAKARNSGSADSCPIVHSTNVFRFCWSPNHNIECFMSPPDEFYG